MQQIALQLYSVRDDLLRDVNGTLDRVRQIGFTAVEAMFWPDSMDLAGFAHSCRQAGLQVCSLHCSIPNSNNIGLLEQCAFELGTRELVWHGWPRDPRHDSHDGVEELVAEYAQAHRLCAGRGMALSLHNHWWEFETFPPPGPKGSPFELLLGLEKLGVSFEIDTYWATVAGMDPVAILGSLATPPRLVHLKDGPGGTESPKLPLGTGILPLDEILESLPQKSWRIIEMDDCETDIWDALSASLATLKGRQ